MRCPHRNAVRCFTLDRLENLDRCAAPEFGSSTSHPTKPADAVGGLAPRKMKKVSRIGWSAEATARQLERQIVPEIVAASTKGSG